MKGKLTIAISCEGATRDDLISELQNWIAPMINQWYIEGQTQINDNTCYWTANFREVQSYRKKGRPFKIPMKDKLEFILQNLPDFHKIYGFYGKKMFISVKDEVVRDIAVKARKDLGYSEKTALSDIARFIYEIYLKNYRNG